MTALSRVTLASAGLSCLVLCIGYLLLPDRSDSFCSLSFQIRCLHTTTDCLLLSSSTLSPELLVSCCDRWRRAQDRSADSWSGSTVQLQQTVICVIAPANHRCACATSLSCDIKVHKFSFLSKLLLNWYCYYLSMGNVWNMPLLWFYSFPSGPGARWRTLHKPILTQNGSNDVVSWRHATCSNIATFCTSTHWPMSGKTAKTFLLDFSFNISRNGKHPCCSPEFIKYVIVNRRCGWKIRNVLWFWTPG